MEFPTDPWAQLEMAIRAVFDSWMGDRAVAYRNYNKIPHDLGTAVNVQAMVFGNMGDDSATGVAFTRNPSTGERVLYGEYLPNAQGEDVVAGTRTPHPISQMRTEMSSVYAQFQKVAQMLERHYKDMQDLEFTVRAREVVDAADPQREADGPGGGQSRGRHGAGEADLEGRGAAARRAGSDLPAAAAAV